MVYWQHYLIVISLVPRWYIAGTTEIAAVSVHVMCTPYNHNPSLHRVNVCLFVTCHLHLSSEWQGSFTCYRGNTGWRGAGGWTSTEIRVSTERWPWRRRFSRRSCRGLEPPNFRSRVWRSNHWAVLAPQAAGSQTFPAIFVLGMSEQLLMRFTKQNRSREMYSSIRRSTRNNETQALSTENCLLQVQEHR